MDLLPHTDYRDCMDYTGWQQQHKDCMDYTGCKDLPPPTPSWQ